MDPKKTPPAPIIDNLAVLQDRRQRESLIHTIPKRFPHINCTKDLDSSFRFLLSYDGTPATFNAYRRELERLLQWSWLIRRVSVHELNREDIVDYIGFIQDPPEAWIGTKNVARFKNKASSRVENPSWRPFVAAVAKSKFRRGEKPDVKTYRPSPASVQATFAVLSSYYDFLTQEDYVAFNPVALIRQKSKFLRKSQNHAPVRRISELQWDYVIDTAELMAAENPNEYERTLFVMTALFAMYLRVSELVADTRSTPEMGDFRRDRDGNWWFHVTGKGNKDRTVAVSDKMIDALKRYRAALNLSPSLPTPGEPTPLISKTRGKGPITSSRLIRLIVQECFDKAYERMKSDGLEEDALDLKEATVHWLRHTGISEDVSQRPREHVRDDAGHASLATTDRYIESDQRERHLTGRNKQVKIFEED
jgi:site-specific recombinase XerD